MHSENEYQDINNILSINNINEVEEINHKKDQICESNNMIQKSKNNSSGNNFNFNFNGGIKAGLLVTGAWFLGAISIIPAIAVVGMKCLNFKNENITLICIPLMLACSPLVTAAATAAILIAYNLSQKSKNVNETTSCVAVFAMIAPVTTLIVAILYKMLDYGLEKAQGSGSNEIKELFTSEGIKRLFYDCITALWNESGKSILGVAKIMSNVFGWSNSARATLNNYIDLENQDKDKDLLNDLENQDKDKDLLKILYADFSKYIYSEIKAKLPKEQHSNFDTACNYADTQLKKWCTKASNNGQINNLQ